MAEAAAASPTVEGPPRWKAVVAAVCVILAALLTIPASFAYWGQRTINDGQRYIDTVGPLVNSPEVQAAIATKVTDAIESQVDVEALLNQVFANVITSRPRLQALIGPLSGAVNSLIETQVSAFIASSAFADFWVAANTRAQEALMRVLKGETSGAVSVQGGQVVLDVTDVVNQVKQRLEARGLTILKNAPPLPVQNTQIVLLDAPQLKQARTIYAFSNPLAKWLLPFVALLYLAALVLSARRPRMTVVIGAALAANALLVALLVSIGRQLFVDHLSGTVFGPASKIFYDTMLSYLERGQRVMLWLGLILVLVGWFVSRTRFGTAVRTTTTRNLESVGAALSDTSAAGAGRWAAVNAVWLRIAVGVLGVVVLLWGNNVSESRLFWSFVLVLVLLAAVQVLVGTGRAAGAGTREGADEPEPEPASGPTGPTRGGPT